VEGPEPRQSQADKQNFSEAGGHRSLYFVGQMVSSTQFEYFQGLVRLPRPIFGQKRAISNAWIVDDANKAPVQGVVCFWPWSEKVSDLIERFEPWRPVDENSLRGGGER
jgi:hypothetical protein